MSETTETTEITVDLVVVAKDLNTGLGLDPEIDTTLPEEELLAAIKQESTQVGQNIKTNKVDLAVAAADEQALSPETWSFLREQGFLKHVEEARAAKAPKGKPAKAEKPAKAPGEKKSNLPPRDFSNSNKAQVFRAWAEGKGETDVEKLENLVDGKVKKTTIRSWLNQWKLGKNHPAIAKNAS